MEIVLLLICFLTQNIQGSYPTRKTPSDASVTKSSLIKKSINTLTNSQKSSYKSRENLPKNDDHTKQESFNEKKSLEKVSIEVERLFDSLNKRRSEIDYPSHKNENENEITVVIEKDDEGGGDDDGDYDSSSPKDDKPLAPESGFAIILDSTDEKSDEASPNSTVDDFAKMSSSYKKMDKRFQNYLSEEKSHILRANSPTSHQPSYGDGPTRKVEIKRTSLASIGTTRQPQTTARGTIEADIEKLKHLREKLKMESEAIDSDAQSDLKEIRSKIIERVNSTSTKNKEESSLLNDHVIVQTRKGNTRNEDDEDEAERLNDKGHEGAAKNTSLPRKSDKAKTPDDVMKMESKQMSTMEHPTGRRMSSSKVYSIRSSRKYYHTITTTKEPIAKGLKSTGYPPTERSQNSDKRIIHPSKAAAMIEYLNKDPLESWLYKYQSLQALGLNSSMLRNGLVNAGSIDRLRSVMERALKGEDITMSIVGGSISAGGGLYKDEGKIDGLYYKGVVDWWNKVITPLTGSEMKVNNIAIGSIGTDYFSYCLKCHVSNNSNIVIWELSGNDYNRYLKMPTKGAKPLERLTRMALQLPRDPAIIYVNFFKGVDYKKTKKNCPNFEDQGEDIISHYYKIPSLSWRAMVCESLIDQNPHFTLKTLFCKDQYHPSLLAHAQMALLLILHLRHVLRSVLQYANAHDGFVPDFASFYNLPAPLFVGLEHPSPLCWTLIAPDFKESIYNTLGVKVLDENGFKLEYATNFPIRFDRVICWKAEKVGAMMKFQITLPEGKTVNGSLNREERKFEIAITTHTRFGGSAEVWLDQRPSNPVVIIEGRPNDTGKRTQVDILTKNADPGVHTLNLKGTKEGFCLASIMVF